MGFPVHQNMEVLGGWIKMLGQDTREMAQQFGALREGPGLNTAPT